MKLISPNNIYLLYALLQEYIEDSNTTEMTNIGYILTNMQSGINAGVASVMVDDENNPRCMMWGVVNLSAFLNKRIFHVAGIYIKKDNRGDSESITKLMDAVQSEAKRLHCDCIFGASWSMGNTEANATNMWESSGFQKIETIYSKEVE